MIKLNDWLINYNPLGELYALSHSQYLEDSPSSREPYRIRKLDNDLYENTRDCLHNFREKEKWQIVFMGTYGECVHRQSDLEIMKKWDVDQLTAWGKETFFEFQKDDDDDPPEGENNDR